MTPEKKLCQIKRPDRTSDLQSQKVQLLLEPVVDKKVHDAYITPPPSVTISLREKVYSTLIPKDEGIVARCLVPCFLEDKCLKLCLT